MSDLVKNLRNWSSLHGGQYSSELTTQAADLIEQQQARIAELEHRAEEAEIRLSIVLDKHGEPDSYECVVYDLTPLESEKKLQDSIKRLGWLPPDEATALRQERDELSAAVDVLREYLRSLVEESTGVVGWHLNGAVADWDEIGATDILGETPKQNLNAVKREVAESAVKTALRNLGEGSLSEQDISSFSQKYASAMYPNGEE